MRKPVFNFRKLPLTPPPKPLQSKPLQPAVSNRPTIGGLLMILNKYQQDTVKSNMEHKWSENGKHVQALYKSLAAMGIADKLDWTGWPVEEQTSEKPR